MSENNEGEAAVVDRIEEGRLAVLLVGEQERELSVPVESLPEGVSEGSWLRVWVEQGRLIRAVLSPEETASVRERVAEKMERLRRRGPR